MSRTPAQAPPAQGLFSGGLGNATLRAVIYQVVFVIVLVALGWWIVNNTIDNLRELEIQAGFGYLSEEAGMPISDTLVSYAETDTYFRAFIVGVLNTLKVAAVGVVLATILGTIVGVSRLSHNWLVAKLASIYVETVRNIPLLLQLFFWYSLITAILPENSDPFFLTSTVVLSKAGLLYPVPVPHFGWLLAVIGIVVAIGIAFYLKRLAHKRQDQTGQPMSIWYWVILALIVCPAAGWAISGAPTEFIYPEINRFGVRGGGSISPEFMALLLGLVIYTAGFIAEIVRSGIQAISHGQTEASFALGLTRGQTLRLVTLPQAMRVIIPPMTSQYLNLTKNSSLAVAIGYQELVSITNTTLNQTGQAIEPLALAMAIYMTISLSISMFMNWYDKKIALKER